MNITLTTWQSRINSVVSLSKTQAYGAYFGSKEVFGHTWERAASWPWSAKTVWVLLYILVDNVNEYIQTAV